MSLSSLRSSPIGSDDESLGGAVSDSARTYCAVSGSSWTDVNGNEMMTIIFRFDGGDTSVDVKPSDIVGETMDIVFALDHFEDYILTSDICRLSHRDDTLIDYEMSWADNNVEAGEIFYGEIYIDSGSSNDGQRDDNESGDDTTRFSPPFTSLPPFTRLPPVVFILKFEHHRRVRNDGFKAYHQVWNLTMFIHNMVKSDIPCSHFCLFHGGIPLGDPDQRLPDAFNFATSNTDEIVIEVNLQFEVQFVINSDNRRRVRGWFKIDDDVDCLMEYICESEYPNPSLGWGDVRLLHKGNDLEDPYQELHDVFNFTTPDPYALYEIEVNLTISGGGKRKAISISELRELPNDPPSVKKVFGITAFVSKAWLNSLSSTELTEYHNALKNAKGMPHQVETTLNKIKEYAELKVGEVFDTQT